MSQEVVEPSEFPPPDIVSFFRVCADEHSLLLRYYSDDKVAIIFFPTYDTFKFGTPNDEAIDGHRLCSKGLELYAAQKVVNSEWIAELEQQNSVHPGHDRELFLKNLAHYTFTGQDSTFECVVYETHGRTEVQQVERAEAKEVWQKYLDRMD